MDLNREISFNEAWKDFLILRPIAYKLGYWLFFDSQGKVTQITIKSLPKREINGEQCFCDDSSIPDIPICYPETIVLPEIEKKIIKPLLGKPLEEWKLDSIKRKHKKLTKDIETQLGGAIRREVQKLVSKKHYWEAMFSLHQILEHRLRKLLLYKSMDIDFSNRTILINHDKNEICEEITGFEHLTNLAFLIGAINNDIRAKLLSFNGDRNNIAHDLLKKKIPTHVLKKLCDHGLKLMDNLELWLSNLIQKPNFIKMEKFEVASYLKD
jgi:hypothetical protein